MIHGLSIGLSAITDAQGLVKLRRGPHLEGMQTTFLGVSARTSTPPRPLSPSPRWTESKMLALRGLG
jgi:hypothetical protein